MAKKKKRSKASSPPSRSYSSKTKKSLKKPIYDSDSSSLSEGEIASDEEPKRKQQNRKRPGKKYDVSDDSTDSSDESDIQSPVQEISQSKCLSFIFYINFVNLIIYSKFYLM